MFKRNEVFFFMVGERHMFKRYMKESKHGIKVILMEHYTGLNGEIKVKRKIEFSMVK